MKKNKADMLAVADRRENVSAMEPLLIGETAKERGALTDLAVDLAARAAGFRRSLPDGVRGALADLVRAMNCADRGGCRGKRSRGFNGWSS
jgi:hypothetical protein